jgi:hypothetical protein
VVPSQQRQIIPDTLSGKKPSQKRAGRVAQVAEPSKPEALSSNPNPSAAKIKDQMPVVHNCNPNYSRSSDQEDCGSKPAQANSLQDPILKKKSQKRAGGVAQVVEHLPTKCEALNSNPITKKHIKPRTNRENTANTFENPLCLQSYSPSKEKCSFPLMFICIFSDAS